MEEYNHLKIESKWQKEWERNKIYQAKNLSKKPKYYSLIEFPYPSGDGLHVGHIRSNTAMDIISRKRRMEGCNVLYPIGWDAFGLPTENYAIKTGKDPRIVTKQNSNIFRKQLKSLGFSFDWSREINTTDPKYYKWTQWMFLQFLKKGLAYKAKMIINWCPKDKIGLANEEVVNGCCERCGTAVEKREKEQWMLAITKYADRLDRDLDNVDYLPQIKLAQRNWIGKSEGAEIEFKIIHPTPALPEGKGEESTKIVILHGKHGTPENYFYPWLKKELEKRSHKVYLPALPNTEVPNDEEQADYVLKNVPLDENTVIVTHSFGGVVAMRLLERGIKIRELILFATPITGTFLDKKSRPSITDALAKGFNYEKIKKQANFFRVIFDSGDTIVRKEDAVILAKNLGIYSEYVKAKEPHFCAIEEPEMLNLILEENTYPLTPSQGEGEFGYHTTDPKTWRALQERVLEMRKNPTEAEKKLWRYLRKNNLTPALPERKGENADGYHFRRQQIIDRFIVDFVCLSEKLVIEVDGDIHDYKQKEDKERTDILRILGFKIIRFKNEEVLSDTDGVIKKISEELKVLPFGEDLGGVTVFTTRPDTIFGATYMVLAPEHPLLSRILLDTLANKKEVLQYIEVARKKSEIEKTAENKIKTGVELKGIKAINPATKEEIPIWIADYILATYGTGAIMAVPADDMRDKEFAEKFSLPIIENYQKAGFEDFGKKITKFKLHDWIFSRQRYWGEPIPVIHCEKCGLVPVLEKDLPIKLPKVKNYQPTENGESPLANIAKWVNTKCPKCKGKAKRETDTMPNWAGSSWYYLRYTDPKNSKAFASQKNLKYWLTPSLPPPKGETLSFSLPFGEGQGGVDWYNGGNEHTTLHLLYSRFWHKFLFNLDLVPTSEPYIKRTSHGLILAKGGEKMSKSKSNVINPDDIVKIYGADTLRLYEMFMGPFDQAITWSEEALIGPRRFLERVWNLQSKVQKKEKNIKIEFLIEKAVKKVSYDIEVMKFNTAISTLMIFTNEIGKYDFISQGVYEKFLKLLSPFAPHLTEEIWSNLKHKDSIHLSYWPKWDENLIKDEAIKIMVQINGKVRAEIFAQADEKEEDVKKKAFLNENISKYIAEKDIKKIIYVKNRLINIVF